MASSFGSASTQVSVLIALEEETSETLTVKSASDEVIITFAPGKNYNNIVVSSPSFAVGDTITLEVGSMTKQVEITDTITGGFGPGGERPQMPEGMEKPTKQ